MKSLEQFTKDEDIKNKIAAAEALVRAEYQAKMLAMIQEIEDTFDGCTHDYQNVHCLNRKAWQALKAKYPGECDKNPCSGCAAENPNPDYTCPGIEQCGKVNALSPADKIKVLEAMGVSVDKFFYWKINESHKDGESITDHINKITLREYIRGKQMTQEEKRCCPYCGSEMNYSRLAMVESEGYFIHAHICPRCQRAFLIHELGKAINTQSEVQP